MSLTPTQLKVSYAAVKANVVNGNMRTVRTEIHDAGSQNRRDDIISRTTNADGSVSTGFTTNYFQKVGTQWHIVGTEDYSYTARVGALNSAGKIPVTITVYKPDGTQVTTNVAVTPQQAPNFTGMTDTQILNSCFKSKGLV